MRFAFGHGLSFTNFSYEWIEEPLVDTEQRVVSLRVLVTNTGLRSGRDVAQLYASYPSTAQAPLRVLKAFQKTPTLQPGRSVVLLFELSLDALRIWDEVSDSWAEHAGVFGLHVGASSRDLRLAATLALFDDAPRVHDDDLFDNGGDTRRGDDYYIQTFATVGMLATALAGVVLLTAACYLLWPKQPTKPFKTRITPGNRHHLAIDREIELARAPLWLAASSSDPSEESTRDAHGANDGVEEEKVLTFC